MMRFDLNARAAAGEKINGQDIRKHKNDVFRLLVNLLPTSEVVTHEEIKEDVREFIKEVDKDRPDLKNIGIRNTNFDEMIDLMKNVFML